MSVSEDIEIKERKKFILQALIVLSVLSSLLLGLMIYYAATKVVIVSAEEASEMAENLDADEKVQTEVGRSWRISVKSTTEDNTISFNGPSVSKDCFFVSKEPQNNTFRFIFIGSEGNYFTGSAPKGDFTNVDAVIGRNTENGAVLEITTKEPCYGEVSLNGNEVIFKLLPLEGDKKTVIIDPLYGGIYTGTVVGDLSEKDINLRVALAVEKMCSDKPYTVRLLRSADVTVTTEERLKIMEIYGMNYYVGIGLNTCMEDIKAFGASATYNDAFYRNGFENGDFAEILLRNVARTAKTRAVSLDKCKEDNVILSAISVPAASVNVGTITNEEEAALLRTDDYILHIAEGIVDALDSVTEENGN